MSPDCCDSSVDLVMELGNQGPGLEGPTCPWVHAHDELHMGIIHASLEALQVLLQRFSCFQRGSIMTRDWRIVEPSQHFQFCGCACYLTVVFSLTGNHVSVCVTYSLCDEISGAHNFDIELTTLTKNSWWSWGRHLPGGLTISPGQDEAKETWSSGERNVSTSSCKRRSSARWVNSCIHGDS